MSASMDNNTMYLCISDNMYGIDFEKWMSDEKTNSIRFTMTHLQNLTGERLNSQQSHAVFTTGNINIDMPYIFQITARFFL